MMIFQFGLETFDQTNFTATGTGADWGFLIPILWLVGILAAAAMVIYLALYFIRHRAQVRSATFDLVTLLITLPKFRREEESERGGSKEDVQETIAAAETFFSAVAGLKAEKGFMKWLLGKNDQFSFEIVMHKNLIKFYAAVPRHLQDFFQQQLSAAYPDAFIEEVEDYNIFSPTGVILGSYLTLKRENGFPIKTYRQLDKDPLNALTNVLSKLPADEGAVFQYVVRSAPGAWRKRGVKIAQDMQQGMSLEEAISGKKKSSVKELTGLSAEDKKPEKEHRLSPQEEETVKGLEEKASKGGMEVCVRLMVSGANAGTAQTTLANMINAFSQYNIYQYGNSFVKSVPKSKNKITQRFIYRAFNEHMVCVLNTEEMASLWHLPTPWTETPNIKWLGARRGAVPSGVPKSRAEEGQLELGFNVYRGIKTPVWMKGPDRSRHMYIIGKSGSGKSETIAKYAIQDIQNGHGVAVVEPHGDLVERILANIPKERVDDVIYFCPSDLERPMGLNMLEAKDESMKDMAVQEMISIFYKLFPPEMIGPQFEHTMRNMMLTLMADQENPGTLAEIPRIITDADFQQEWVAKVKDPVVRAYWEKEVANTSDFHKSEMFGYLTSKVGRFVENEMMRNIIGQSHSSFDFREVMDKKKILLVNLSKGKTGDVNSELLGMIIVSKLQMAALGRADMPESERSDFYLYIDEFQNFITDSIATILSEARKYRLNLIIAHQYIGQLVKNGDTKIRDAVFGNVGTNFVARIGPEDVEMLEPIYSPEFSGYDLMNSDKFTWYVKMIVDNSQVKPFTMNLAPSPSGNRELAEAIKELSRLKYGRDRAIVEAEILERSQLGTAGRGPQRPGPGEI
ncbi:type IV secretion system DNA-binding domain-containing protein [Patescibacteria group bacterium]|nr:type IV secretion system DNA-binding domain-containing protein [Patescibacteria group bacterium]MBU1705667.1 type IV secretion system DNA-binding domain-containing protein [Patescibacteria group bacterium]